MEAATPRSNAKQRINRADILPMLTQLIYLCKRLNGNRCYGAFSFGCISFASKKKFFQTEASKHILNLDNFITHGEASPLLYQCAVAHL